MRPDGWERRLKAFIDARKGQPFAWGANDCASFAADAVLAQTGVDPMADWRGYDSEFGAARVLVTAGATSLADLVTRVLTPCPVGLAQRGDVALVMQGNEPTLMIVAGDWLIGPGLERMKMAPRSAAVMTWRAA